MEEIFLVWVIVWLISAFICGAINSSRGQSYAGGFFTGLFLGVFGIILLLFMSPGIKSDEVKQLKRDEAYAKQIQETRSSAQAGAVVGPNLSGWGQISVSRRLDKGGQLVKYRVFVNGQEVGVVSHKETAVFTVPAGDCVVHIKSKGGAKCNSVGFKVNPGQIVELQVRYTFSGLLLTRSVEKMPVPTPSGHVQTGPAPQAAPPNRLAVNTSKVDQAVSLARNGQKQEAIVILKDVVAVERDNEKAWLCLYWCLDRAEQKKYCLREVLRINPANGKARQVLEQLSSPAPAPLPDTSPTAKTGPLRNCAYCGKPLSRVAKYCPHCGHTLDGEDQAVDPAPAGLSTPPVQPVQYAPVMVARGPETEPPPMVVSRAPTFIQCPVCKRTNPNDANQCAYCGYPFYSPPTPSSAPYYPAASRQEAEPRRFRLHFVDFAALVILVSIFLPWASIHNDTFLGDRTSYYDAFGVAGRFDGSASMNIAAIIFLVLGLGAPVLVHARLKPLAILSALGALAAQIYIVVTLSDVSGMDSGWGGIFYDITTVTMREGVIVGLVGAALVFLGTIFYQGGSSGGARKFFKVVGILLLIILLLVAFLAAGWWYMNNVF